ncbi:hypothetical protein BC834DRAFT_966476 [Gloeopeniophorella convolvens]|nr:hypothetical protein BC834DRAFT_966476 [Gloeopeniophorella convolvens]
MPQPQIPPSSTNGGAPSQAERYIQPMHADQVSRYTRKYDVPRDESWFRALQPCTLELARLSELHSGEWEPKTHPLGGLYFYHDGQNAYTDAYMFDGKLRHEADAFCNLLATMHRHLKGTSRSDSGRDELVLDINTMRDGKVVWSYYYVDHGCKNLYWLHPYDITQPLLYEACGISEPRHISHRMESLYWYEPTIIAHMHSPIAFASF